MNSKIETVKIKDIKTGENPRSIDKKAIAKSELYKSIQHEGVQHPIELVSLQNDDHKYQLLSGGRRLTIATLLKNVGIPAIIYSDITDAEMYDKTHFENAFREDLSILDQFENALNLMAKNNNDHKAVAAKLNVTEKMLHRILNINNLTTKWLRTLTAKTEHAKLLQQLSLAHLELIAKLKPEFQDQILSENWLCNWDDAILTVDNLKRAIDERFTCLLSGAVWYDKCCKGCLLNSDNMGQGELWDGMKVGKKTVPICTDKKCFEANGKKHLEGLINTIQESGADAIFTCDSNIDLDLNKDFKFNCYSSWSITKAKASDKGAKLVYDIKPYELTRSYGKLPKSTNGTVKKAGKKTLKEKKLQLKGLRNCIVLAALSKASKEKTLNNTIALCLPALVGAFGTAQEYNDNKIKLYFVLANSDCKSNERLWKLVKPQLLNFIKAEGGEAGNSTEKAGKFIAELIDFSWEDAFKTAEQEKPEPKSWKALKK